MTTRYKVHFRPSFHPETEIEVLFGDEGDFIRVQSAGHTVQARLSVEQGAAFREKMDALVPDTLPDGDKYGIDGCHFTCGVQDARGAVHTFSAWRPHPERAPRQHAFISLVHRLAWDTVREPATVSLLEHLWGYFSDGLPARVFHGEPLRIRIFGRLSSSQSNQFDALFASVPPQVPVLMDMTNLELMGWLLFPHFRHFHERAGRTAWLVSESSDHSLRAAGIPVQCLHRELESALVALQKGA